MSTESSQRKGASAAEVRCDPQTTLKKNVSAGAGSIATREFQNGAGRCVDRLVQTNRVTVNSGIKIRAGQSDASVAVEAKGGTRESTLEARGAIGVLEQAI